MSSGRGARRGGFGGGGDSPRRGGYGGGARGGSPGRGGPGRGGPGRGGPGRGRGAGPSGPPRRDLSNLEPQFPVDLKPGEGQVAIRGPSEFVTRPGYVANVKNVIQLVSNNYAIKLTDTSIVVYHYDVEISGIPIPTAQGKPKKERKLTKAQNRKVFKELCRLERKEGGLFHGFDGVMLPVFDGNKNIYTVQPLNEIGTNREASVTRTIRIKNDECKEGYSDHTVTIKVTGDADDVEAETEITWSSINDYYKGILPTFPLQAIQILNTVMKSGPLERRIEVGANSMYTVDCDRRYLGRGIEYAFGNFQSIRPIAAGLSIVIDRTATAFYQNLSAKEFIEKFAQRGDRPVSVIDVMRNQRMREEVEKELRNIHFYTTYLGRKKIFKKFHELSSQPAERLTFESPSGRVSIANYFRREYNIVLEHPELPCMDFGNDNRHTYIPLELCTLVENQHIREVLKAEQNSQLIRATATEPRQRFLEIQEFTHGIKNESKDYMKEFKIDMDVVPIRAWGKVIAPPVLVYGHGKTVEPADGKWDLRNIAVKNGIRIQKWVAFYFYERQEPDEEQFYRFLNSLQDMARKMNILMGEPAVVEMLTFRDAGNRLNEIVTNMKPQLVLFVQPKNDLFRARVKHLCEVTFRDPGAFSQCILEDVYRRANLQVQANILLKINAKCGGVNHILQNKPAPLARPNGVMIIGADVTHSAPANVLERSLTAASGGVRFEASIAAIVGTIDSEYFRYHTEVKVQRKERQEIISNLETMIESIIRSYYVSNDKKLPQTIIFYRDGVSEGQFRAVLDLEVAQMERAFQSISARLKQQYRPKITFIVVQKRHHTRLRPQFEQEGVGRMKNVPPGTVVDTIITHPRDFDWFLNSHEGIQASFGLSRPSHYYVLRDDCKFTADELTEMTYHLCHTYAKATRSVSIPSPVFYAHLAAYRARDHISTYAPSGGRQPQPPQEETDDQREQRFQRCLHLLNSRVQVTPRLKQYMYYC